MTLIITGGLRTESDFVKALALGAVAVSNFVLQAIRCLAMRACHTNNCPVDRDAEIESPRPAGDRGFCGKAPKLVRGDHSVDAGACGHASLGGFNIEDLTTTWKQEMARLSGVRYSGVSTAT